MNFLLHRHLAEREMARPGAGLGAMLPDLWRMVDRRQRPRPGVAADAADPPELAGLLAGVDHHVAADRWFHATDVFRRGVAATAERLRRERFTATKVVLLAHVAWELCLDGALVHRLGLETVLAGLRRDLGVVPRAALDDAALRHGLGVHLPGHAARRAFGDRLLARLDDLAAGDWIAGYRHGPGLAARLDGVRRRVRLPPLPPPDRHRLATAMDDTLPLATDALPRLLGGMPSGG